MTASTVFRPVDAPPGGPRRGRSTRSPRLRLVVCATVVVAALAWIAVRGLTSSFVYYLTPSDIVGTHKTDVGQRVRLGGLVVAGSVSRVHDGTLSFTVTDGRRSMRVVSTGSVPELFRAGQGVVLEGALRADHRFHADTLLVKHDGQYRAPDLGSTAQGG
jgi:cytochrome c-type biogenesis protein CcmE